MNCYGDSNKVYIGKTKNSREREHKKKFGDFIEYSYVDEINSLKRIDWEPLETYWIEQFKAWGFEVVNKRKKGGSGPEFQTEESKKKQSFKMIDRPKPLGFGKLISEIKKGVPNPKNKIKPDGWKEKLKKPHKVEYNISISNKFKPSSKKVKKYVALKDPHLKNIKRKKPVLQIDPDSYRVIKEWESRNSIIKEIGYGIAGAINNNTKWKKYYWKYK